MDSLAAISDSVSSFLLGVASLKQNSAHEVKRQFGRRLREVRKLKGVSQEELALRSDLDRSYVGQVERGERNLTLVNIHRLASGLAIEPYVLLESVGGSIPQKRR